MLLQTAYTVVLEKTSDCGFGVPTYGNDPSVERSLYNKTHR